MSEIALLLLTIVEYTSFEIALKNVGFRFVVRLGDLIICDSSKFEFFIYGILKTYSAKRCLITFSNVYENSIFS